MRIVNRGKFMTLPAGTVFQKFGRGEPGPHLDLTFGPISIKGETTGEDFVVVDYGSPWPADCECSDTWIKRLIEMAEQGADSGPLDFDCGGRDGLFDDGQRFAVWSADDVLGLVKALAGTIGLSVGLVPGP